MAIDRGRISYMGSCSVDSRVLALKLASSLEELAMCLIAWRIKVMPGKCSGQVRRTASCYRHWGHIALGVKFLQGRSGCEVGRDLELMRWLGNGK